MFLIRSSLYSVNFSKTLLRYSTNIKYVRDEYHSNCRRRSTSSSVASGNIGVITETEKWETIYRFSGVKFFSAINKLKIYQFAFTTFSMPLLMYLESIKSIDSGTAVIFGTVGITGTITLCLCSYFTQNIVGFIYINKAEDKLRFSYANFWGYRKDTVVDTSDIVPISELPKHPINIFYHNIKTTSNTIKTLKIPQKFGQIYDYEKFASILGES